MRKGLYLPPQGIFSHPIQPHLWEPFDHLAQSLQ